jgi:hypothetical protein
MSLRERARPGFGISEPCFLEVFINADFRRGPNPRCCYGSGFLKWAEKWGGEKVLSPGLTEWNLSPALGLPEWNLSPSFLSVLALGRLHAKGLVKRRINEATLLQITPLNA